MVRASTHPTRCPQEIALKLIHQPIEIVELDARAVRFGGAAAESGYNAAKLRRLHEKRAKKLQRSRERRNKSGGFLTGFTLVTMVTATFVGLYVLQPQIIAASPRMKPALTEYVDTVDRYRFELNEKTTEWKAWLVERVGALGDDDEG